MSLRCALFGHKIENRKINALMSRHSEQYGRDIHIPLVMLSHDGRVKMHLEQSGCTRCGVLTHSQLYAKRDT